MLLPLLLAALSLQSAPADTLSRGSAFLDDDARELVRRVRERQAVDDRSIAEYSVLAHERVSVGLRALSRDRVLFRRELAANVHWSRDGVGRVEVLGARQVVPVAVPRPTVPRRVRREATDLAFDPTRGHLIRGFSADGDDDFRHPLAPGAEADYRFQTGDTTRMRLSGDRVLTLVELRVIPRRPAALLLQGSFWIDAESAAPVRATFRFTRPVDVERDLGEDEEDLPGIFKPLTGELRFITIDYGYWEQRWWLPRLVSLEVLAEAGSLVRIPVTFERSYTGYRVVERQPATGEDAGPPPAEADTTGTVKSCDGGTCARYVVELPEERESLLRSDHLPPSIYEEGESLITEAELREMADVFGVSPPGAAGWQRPEVRLSYLRPGLLRYNRVQGLAVAGRADADLGPVEVDATAWVETAGPDLSGELGVTRGGFRFVHRAAVYRRLAAVDPDPRAQGPGSSLAALVLGRDDGDYFRSLGVEVAGASAAPRSVDLSWRLFAERQSAAPKRTDLSLARLLDGDREFAPNIDADAADQVGAEASLRWTRGQDPLGFRWGAEAAVDAEAGDFRFVRPSLATRAGFPLPLGLVGALEVAGGTAFGEAPLQRHWFLGGPATVRGFGGGSRIHGDTYWRSRAEVATSFPGARLVAFSDAGWAGPRAELAGRAERLSAGAGVSLLDGLLRLDLARALRGGRGWRLDVHLDAPL